MLHYLPQILVVGLQILGLGISIAKHGQPREGNENAGITFIGFIILLVLLFWGGFFN